MSMPVESAAVSLLQLGSASCTNCSQNISKIAEDILYTIVLLQAANDMTAMVTAAPAIFMVALVELESDMCSHLDQGLRGALN